MKHLNYQTLETMADYSALWYRELTRNMETLNRADFSFAPGGEIRYSGLAPSAEYMTAWYNARRSTLEAQAMHRRDLTKIRHEMARRRLLVGWL